MSKLYNGFDLAAQQSGIKLSLYNFAKRSLILLFKLFRVDSRTFDSCWSSCASLIKEKNF